MIDLFSGIEPTQTMRMPPAPIMRAAEVERGYRWSMTRAWGSGPCVSWTLFNPSDADATRDDPTTLRMIGFSYRWGFGSMVVTNVYPFVSSTPHDLWEWRKEWDESQNRHGDWAQWPAFQTPYNAWLYNMMKVREAMNRSDTHVAAWGNGPRPADLREFTLGATFSCDTSEHDGLGVVQIPVEWKCLGRTIGGAPKHPLARGNHRVPDDAVLSPWGER